MMKTCWQPKTLFVLACIAGLAGCGAPTKSPRLYLLSATPAAAQATTGANDTTGQLVKLSTVSVPEYLERAQMVTRPAANRLEAAEFDRWAESLQKGVSRVMAMNLRALLPGSRVVQPPLGGPESLRIFVEIQRLDGTLGKEAVLDATWTLKGPNSNAVSAAGVAHYIEPLEASDFAAYASAQSKLIDSLCREIAIAVGQAPAAAAKSTDASQRQSASGRP